MHLEYVLFEIFLYGDFDSFPSLSRLLVLSVVFDLSRNDERTPGGGDDILDYQIPDPFPNPLHDSSDQSSHHPGGCVDSNAEHARVLLIRVVLYPAVKESIEYDLCTDSVETVVADSAPVQPAGAALLARAAWQGGISPGYGG